MPKKPVLDAAVATVLFTGTLGVLIAVAAFGVIRLLDQMLEAVNFIPLNWGESHLDILMEISGGLSLPIMLWFSLWFYRHAVKAERKLTGYKYNPPA
jgi:hypothetical protein